MRNKSKTGKEGGVRGQGRTKWGKRGLSGERGKGGDQERTM